MSRLNLTKQLIVRDIAARYKGSFLGVLWSFATPLLMLTVYTVFFSLVMKIKWGLGENENKFDFAVFLFVGLIFHAFISESIMRSPSLMAGHVNYVKKVVFPLETLPVMVVGSALFHVATSLLILLLMMFVSGTPIKPGFVLVLLPLIPLVIYALGLSYLLSVIGAFFKDISQFSSVISQALLFTAPIFFPLASVPDKYLTYFRWNPLTDLVEEARRVALLGGMPDFSVLGLHLALSVMVLLAGALIFSFAKKSFADVL